MSCVYSHSFRQMYQFKLNVKRKNCFIAVLLTANSEQLYHSIFHNINYREVALFQIPHQLVQYIPKHWSVRVVRMCISQAHKYPLILLFRNMNPLDCSVAFLQQDLKHRADLLYTCTYSITTILYYILSTLEYTIQNK